MLKKNKIILLDGSSGVALQKAGMPKGVCPEKWAISNKNHLLKLQRDYINAGSQIIYTFTFGANRTKLNEFNLGKEVFSINKRLTEISKSIAKKFLFLPIRNCLLYICSVELISNTLKSKTYIPLPRNTCFHGSLTCLLTKHSIID
mgnify:CR=1 FL=1